MKKNLRSEILSSLKIVIIALILGVGTSYIFASSWTPPTASAPNNNADAPINVSNTAQAKQGSLSVNAGSNTTYSPMGFSAFGESLFQAFNPTGVNGVPVAVAIGATSTPSTIQIVDGNQAAGKILTSDGSGNATWQNPSVSSNWTALSLTDTSDFDVNCTYRFKTNESLNYYTGLNAATDGSDTWLYLSGVGPKALIFVAHNSVVSFISSVNRTWFEWTGNPNTYHVTALQEICPAI